MSFVPNAIMLNKIIVSLMFLCLLVAFTGCKKAKIAGLVPAEGNLVYNGIPLAWSSIAFIPEDASSGRPATGNTDENGKFILRTLGEPGALPGKYNVMVARFIVDEGPNSLKNWKKKRSDGEPEPKPNSEATDVKVISAIPAKYQKAKQSGIKITVNSQGDRSLKIELKD